MSADRETLAVYDARAADYVRLGGTEPDPRLDAFIDGLPPGGAVLDLGCGPGRAAARMAERGLDVQAVDASAEMVALAARAPGVNVRQATFDEALGTLAPGSLDGIWASFSLLHAPRDAMPGYLSALHAALRPGGRLMLGLKLGEGEGRDALGRFYCYYTDAGISGLLAAAGFVIEGRDFGRDRGLDGMESPWIILIARRPA